jgi:hypothetical protein
MGGVVISSRAQPGSVCQLPGGTGTERLRQMERAKYFLISL